MNELIYKINSFFFLWNNLEQITRTDNSKNILRVYFLILKKKNLNYCCTLLEYQCCSFFLSPLFFRNRTISEIHNIIALFKNLTCTCTRV